jgi:hypothetical protein
LAISFLFLLVSAPLPRHTGARTDNAHHHAVRGVIEQDQEMHL